MPLAFVALAAFILFVGWPCPLRLATGLPCPTCGLTRATRLVLRGDFAAATAMHPLVWLVMLLAAAFAGIEIVGYWRSGRWGASVRTRWACMGLLVTALLLVALWLARFAGCFGGPVPPT
ncbi:MAG: DUF2752 domain-containing protein [Polyangiaceae bacterium]|nr:DUF2752 domain-containing protein [Polyangiaceae bacterium]